MSERPNVRRPGRREGARNHLEKGLDFRIKRRPLLRIVLITDEKSQRRKGSSSLVKGSRHGRETRERKPTTRPYESTLWHPLKPTRVIFQLGAARNEDAPRDQYCILCNSRYSQNPGSRPRWRSPMTLPVEVSPRRAGSHRDICVHRGRPRLSESRHLLACGPIKKPYLHLQYSVMQLGPAIQLVSPGDLIRQRTLSKGLFEPQGTT